MSDRLFKEIKENTFILELNSLLLRQFSHHAPPVGNFQHYLY